MDKICELLDIYDLCWNRDEELAIPHIVYEKKASDDKTVISHNFVVEYCDLINEGFLVAENLETSFYNFERKYFSKYFFREDTDKKWNFYLVIIVSESESVDPNICQLEQDDKYLRKLVMTEAEFEVYIGHGRNIKDNSEQVINGIDTYAEWQRELSKVGLEGILVHSYENIRVKDYIEKDVSIRFQGRPIQNWENTGKINSKFLVQRIKTLSMENFRSHCLAEHMKIPLTSVNLISGCNGTGKSSICSAVEYALTGEILGSKEENGSVKARIKNCEGKYVNLYSKKLTKDKKSLDQLWYGTVTAGRNSSLNRNFHTFNYLGLEASGKYMQELNINELVKNVLFGLEVTEAEQKMQRYGKAFADKKKEYGKQLELILQGMSEIQIDYDIKGISVEELREEFQELGYKGEFILINQTFDGILNNWRELLLGSNQYVDMLILRCDEDETGISIMEKMKELNEKRKLFQDSKMRREKLRQNLQKLHQKSKDNHSFLKKLYEKIQNVKALIQQGEGMRYSFSCKRDFLMLKNEYEKNSNMKEELANWVNQYQEYINSEGNEIELDNEIQNKEANISGMTNELGKLVRQIELQKRQNDNMDTIIQEIFNLVEQYSALNVNAEKCPVCGTNFESKKKLMKAINEQKQFRVIDENLLQVLLKHKMEKEKCLGAERDSLKLLKAEKENALQKRIAISKLKGIMPIDETKSGADIQKEVIENIEQMQKYMEKTINKYEYAQKVLKTDEFVDYSEKLDWINYLEKFLLSLEEQVKEMELLLKEQALQEQEVELEYQKAMEECVTFSEKEWEEYQLKATGFQTLANLWEIDENNSVRKWIDKFKHFFSKLQYAEEMYGKQETIKLREEQMEKLEKERKVIEERIQKCRLACEVIERQKRLEDVMKEFLIQNAKQIELFFKLLHRPKEFSKLSIHDGNIRFMRNSNGQWAESGQMSTGQRMALAFSVMITLHISAANAPNFLMLDEPVANLDDMHVLNLIDLLREIAISGTQIIITTADSQMAKFLRRKFSFLKDEYSHFELTRKGNAQTLIDVIHYSPDMKAAKNTQHLY